MNAPTPTQRTQRLRFGIRVILLLMVILAVPLTWVSRVWSQRRAVEAIRNAGGIVSYDYQVEYRSRKPGRKGMLPPTEPQRPHSVLGDDFVANVVSVNLRHMRGSQDELLSLVPSFPHVTSLTVDVESDVGMAYLARARSLTSLSIGGEFTEAGLAKLASLTQLERLSVFQPDLTEVMITTLGTLTTLKYLYVEVVSSEDLDRLKKALPGCTIEYFQLHDSHSTDGDK